jgi:hypothetical protein
VRGPPWHGGPRSRYFREARSFSNQMRHLARALAAIVMLGTVIAAPEADAITPLRLLGAAQGVVVADGARYAAYDPLPGVTRIIDTRGDTSRVVPLPAGCRTAAIGAGQLMRGCDLDEAECPALGRTEWPLLLDLGSGATSVGPLSARPGCSGRYSPGQYRRLTGIGRAWIGYFATTYHVAESGFVSRADGHQMRAPTNANQAIDLNVSSGQVPLCPPMRAEDNELIDLVQDRYRAFDFERPWGLTTTGGAESSPAGAGYTLRLERCGGRSKTISRCEPHQNCLHPMLASGIVTWGLPLRVFALNVRTGRRHSWRLPSGSLISLTHTRDRLFATTYRYPQEPRNLVYSASLKGL